MVYWNLWYALLSYIPSGRAQGKVDPHPVRAGKRSYCLTFSMYLTLYKEVRTTNTLRLAADAAMEHFHEIWGSIRQELRALLLDILDEGW